MCGACRVSVGGETKFACVDGPEFDGQLVDFDELAARLTAYKDQERLSFEEFKKSHGLFGELADCIGHHGETAPGVAGPSRLDGGV